MEWEWERMAKSYKIRIGNRREWKCEKPFPVISSLDRSADNPSPFISVLYRWLPLSRVLSILQHLPDILLVA